MKRFLIISTVLAALFVMSWVKVFPVRCEVCHEVLFRTNVTSLAFGGHGDCAHVMCVPQLSHLMWPTVFASEIELVKDPPGEPG